MMTPMLQLDFVGNIYSPEQQLTFDDRRSPVFSKVEKFFHSISKDEIDRHCELWNKIVPESSEEIFKRYLFAFLSVHSTWESNVKGYLATKDWYNWIANPEVLSQRLQESRIGLHNNRTKYLIQFAQDFWQNSKKYQKQADESWADCRDRIEKNILGLGLAKSSFALEMIYPMESSVVCLDTHLFQFYSLNQNKHTNQYKKLESHWTQWAKMFNLPSYIARCIYWNRNQNKNDCSYWSFVFN